MKEFSNSPEQSGNEQAELRLKIDQKDTPFNSRLVFLNLLIVHQRKQKTPEAATELANLETEVNELWAAASPAEMWSWAEIQAADYKGRHSPEDFFKAAVENSVQARIMLTKKKSGHQKIFDDTMDELKASPRILGKNLKKAMRNDDTKGLPPLDIN